MFHACCISLLNFITGVLRNIIILQDCASLCGENIMAEPWSNLQITPGGQLSILEFLKIIVNPSNPGSERVRCDFLALDRKSGVALHQINGKPSRSIYLSPE
jgi:hypothetical protein